MEASKQLYGLRALQRKIPQFSVISAPTLCADNCDKDRFYMELQIITISLPKDDMVVIWRNWNASYDAAMVNLVAGKYGTRIRYTNRERLLCFAELLLAYPSDVEEDN